MVKSAVFLLCISKQLYMREVTYDLMPHVKSRLLSENFQVIGGYNK